MARRPTVVLFDVDGTLVTTGGAGRRAMRHAFGEVCGAPHALDGVKLGGKTDPMILREGLTLIGQPFDPDVVERVLEVYLARLEEELPRSTGYRVFHGVLSLLERLEADAHAVGLGTGNVERGAYLKLARAGLDRFFGFGGFGSDAEDRAELVRAGAKRGATRLMTHVDDCHVVVVGDTPRDVDAAHAAGAVCLAVATGGFAADALTNAGADLVVETLEDPRAVTFLFEPR
ncbi:MAG: HAD hydrolase-like protein [Myxococcales bacterium]|nr:HAD hydrolase-like protein [Myxococcales bacterium]